MKEGINVESIHFYEFYEYDDDDGDRDDDMTVVGVNVNSNGNPIVFPCYRQYYSATTVYIEILSYLHTEC